MALDFPTSPALNQVYTFGSYSWRWDGTSWVGAVPIVNATINNTTIGAVTPSTGAFTTLSASGGITNTQASTASINNVATGASSTSRYFASAPTTGTGYLLFTDTTLASNRGYIGYTFATDALDIATAGVVRGAFSSTGLAVTGALSSTGLATFTSNYSSTLAGSINMTSNIPLITWQNSGSGSNRNFMVANGYSNPGVLTLAISGSAGGAATAILSEWTSTGLAVTGALSATTITGTTSLRIGTASSFGGAVGQLNGANVVQANGVGMVSIASTDAVAADKGGSLALAAKATGGAETNPYPMAVISGRAVNATDLSGYFAVATSDASGTIAERLRLTSTGLAVTGTLSSTGTVLGSNGVRINGAFLGNLASSVGFDFFSGSGRMFHWDSGGTGTNVFSWNATGLAVTGALSATAGLTTGTAAALALGGSGSNLQVGFLSGTVTSTTDAYVSWAGGSSTPLNPSAVNGSLVLAARNTAGAEVVLAAGNTAICRVASTGLAVTGNTKSTFPGSTGGSAGYGFWAQDSTDASGAGFAGFAKASGTVIGSITRVTTTDAVVYNTTSDGRLKENLRDFTDSGRLIDSLKPRVFDWKNSDENGKNVIGFIAQEEHAADPIFAHIGAVSVGDEDPETITKQWQRSDSALIPILVAELKALRQRVAALEKSN